MLITGFHLQKGFGGEVSPYLTAEFDEFADITGWPAGASVVPNSGIVTLSTHWPVEAVPRLLVASKAISYSDDFYHRVHLKPNPIALGNILTAQTRQVEVWNAHLTAKSLSAIVAANSAGLSLTEPIIAPTTFAPLEARLYDLTVSTSGPANVDATFSFAFAGETPVLAVTGRRVVVFAFPPNWNTPVTETLEWFTQVLRAFDGTEQRRGLRTKARRSFTYSATVRGDHASRFDNTLWGWQHRVFALPIWTDKCRLTSAVAAGATSLSVMTTGYSFYPDGLAVIYDGISSFEVVEIDSLASNELVLKRPVEAAWGSGTLVYPCNLAHLPNAVTVARHTDNTLVATLDFQCDPATTDPITPDASPAVTYDGLEVITQHPNWLNAISNTFDYTFDTLDMQTGAIQWESSEEFPRIQRGYAWLLKDRARITAFRELLGRLKGQLKPVRIASWHDDFQVVEPITSAQDFLVVTENEFIRLVGLNPARDRIVIRLTDGTVFYRAITGVSATGINSKIAIDAPLARDVSPDEIKIVHLLMCSRMASDRVDMQWHSDERVVVDTPFITVKE